MTDSNTVYELLAVNDSRKSFYGKAQVQVNSVNGDKTLFSYNTVVAKKVGDSFKLNSNAFFSSTTLRHVKEFLQQEGFHACKLTKSALYDYAANNGLNEF